MSDPTPLNTLAVEIIKINTANGWRVTQPHEWSNDPYKIPGVLALIHSEVSEALEGYRLDDRENFAEELADVIIRVLDLTSGLGIDIDHEVQMKMQKNREREFRHGGKRL